MIPGKSTPGNADLAVALDGATVQPTAPPVETDGNFDSERAALMIRHGAVTRAGYKEGAGPATVPWQIASYDFLNGVYLSYSQPVDLVDIISQPSWVTSSGLEIPFAQSNELIHSELLDFLITTWQTGPLVCGFIIDVDITQTASTFEYFRFHGSTGFNYIYMTNAFGFYWVVFEQDDWATGKGRDCGFTSGWSLGRHKIGWFRNDSYMHLAIDGAKQAGSDDRGWPSLHLPAFLDPWDHIYLGIGGPFTIRKFDVYRTLTQQQLNDLTTI